MSLFTTLRTGASGLGVSGTSLGVIGDNIANLNTTGFKGSSANFSDVLPQYLGSSNGAQQLGRGAGVASISTSFGQGSLRGTGNSLDVAISGNGFFQVNKGAESFYTRDGSFHLDPDGWVSNAGGLRLQGYQATDGTVGSTVGDLRLQLGTAPPKATTNVIIEANLAGVSNPVDDFSATDRSGSATAADISTLSGLADYATSTTVYDSLGKPHDVTVFMEETATGEWSWSAVVDAGEADSGTGPDATLAGKAFEISSGSMSFDTNGELASVTGPTATAAAWNWPGAAGFAFNWEVGMDSAGVATADGKITAQGEGTSTTMLISQDGYAPGTPTGIRVDADGLISADYTNGEEMVLGQLALATFQAEGGLERVGGNLFRGGLASGEAALGVAGSGGRGSTVAYALEGSNVDLEDQFVNMIQAQRSYQANGSVVRKADETLQALINLV